MSKYFKQLISNLFGQSRSSTLSCKSSPLMGQLHSLIENDQPDEFTTACRNALLQIVCEMPVDQAQIIYDHITVPCPWTTEAEHEAWLNSYQCKAMRLELTLKEQTQVNKDRNP